MAIEHAMWIHGHSIHIEEPSALQFAPVHKGFMVELIGKPNHMLWVHYAIPTPVITENKRLTPDALFVRYRTEPGDNTSVSMIDVYDGEERIAQFAGLGPSTDWVAPQAKITDADPLKWGIGVSILIKFSGIAFPKFQISGVGMDFLA